MQDQQMQLFQQLEQSQPSASSARHKRKHKQRQLDSESSRHKRTYSESESERRPFLTTSTPQRRVDRVDVDSKLIHAGPIQDLFEGADGQKKTSTSSAPPVAQGPKQGQVDDKGDDRPND